MRSFVIFFVSFCLFVGVIFGAGFYVDTLLQPKLQVTGVEGSGLQISDHRTTYPDVSYSWYIDGNQVSGATSAGLLLDWKELQSTLSGQDGNNQSVRTVERVMKDNYQESKEYMASLQVYNSIPVFQEVQVASANIDAITFSLRALDQAKSDYPLGLDISLKNSDGTMLYETHQSVEHDDTQHISIPTEFSWCNTTKILSLGLHDDEDSVYYEQEVTISCNTSSDIISNNLFSSLIANQSDVSVVSEAVAQHEKNTYSQQFNLLFSNAFLQAIATRRVIL